MFDEHGVPEPIRAYFLPDAIEALVALGRLERAEGLLDAFEEAARRPKTVEAKLAPRLPQARRAFPRRTRCPARKQRIPPRTNVGKHLIPETRPAAYRPRCVRNPGQRGFLVECHWPGVNETKLGYTVGRARTAADDLRRQGRDLRFVGSILVPADETVFWLFDGDQADVRGASEQAGVAFERVLESVRIDGSNPTRPEAP